MLLKTAVAALIIVSLVAKTQTAAITYFEASTPIMPALKLAQSETNIALKMEMSPLNGLNTIQGTGAMVPMPPSPDSDVSIATQTVNFLYITIQYNPAQLSIGEVKTRGEVVVDFSASNFTLILSASIAADGSCKLTTEVAPIAVDVDVSMAGMRPLSDAITEAPKMLSSIKAYLVDFLTPSILSAVTDFVDTAIENSAEGPTAVCKSIVYGEPISPISASS